jgi:hypothetical protein
MMRIAAVGEAPTTEGRDVAAIAKGLTHRQQQLAMGRYDDDFASHEDATVLERAGIWAALPPDDEDEFYRFDITPLGLLVRQHLNDIQGANNE